ncbi:MAG: DUF2062 domain-containing protein [Nitrospirae bacterium]|nr:DUF2062 domain-containing protein [Nitrospirota bacterium]
MAFKDKFRQIFYINDTPHRIALSFAIGVFMGIAPLVGLHIVGALAAAWLLRLNKLVAFAGVCVLNPWTIVPMYSFSLWLGVKLMGMTSVIPQIDWGNESLLHIMKKLSHLLIPFVIGTSILSIISTPISYFIIKKIAIKYKKENAS